MRNTLWVNFQEPIHPSIQEFSTLTKPSISANPSRISSSSWVSTTTVTSSPTISSVHKWMLGTRRLTNVPRMSSIPMHLSVDDGMWGNVQWKHVSTSTSVQSVTHDTNQRTVLAQQQHMIWNGCVWIGHGVISGPHIIFHSHLLPLVQKWPPPFVDVPMMELHNVTALKTIAAWPDLSKLSWLSGLKDSMNSYLHTLIRFSLTLSATALGKGYGHSWTLTHQHQKIFLCHYVS